MLKDIIPVFLGKIENGALKLDTPKEYNIYLLRLNNKKVQLVIKLPRKQRTNPENRYMWGVVYKLLSEVTGYTAEEIHDAMRMLFLLDRDRKIPTLKSTASLTTVEIELYLTKIREFASLELNCYIPLPNEVDYE